MAMAQSSNGKVTKSRGRGSFGGFFFPVTMHCNTMAAKRDYPSPIISCSRRCNSVGAAFAANGISGEGDNGSE